MVKVPDIGEGIAEVELVAWHVQAGDTVVADQVLADVMTDKATVEVPSPVAGTCWRSPAAPGDKLAVGSELIRIEVDGARPDAAARAGTRSGRASATRGAAANRSQRRRTPLQRRRASVAPAQPAAATARAPRPRSRTSPSPRLRCAAHARELSVDLAQVHGSGPDGRVTARGLVRFARRAVDAPPGASAPQRSGERRCR